MSPIEIRLIEACIKSRGGPMTPEEQEIFDQWVTWRQEQNPAWLFYLVLGIAGLWVIGFISLMTYVTWFR
jgi:hypothetical protein